MLGLAGKRLPNQIASKNTIAVRQEKGTAVFFPGHVAFLWTEFE
jgi:hypothetical protein